MLLISLVIVLLFGLAIGLKSILKKEEVKHNCSCGANRGGCSTSDSCDN